ncbi:hypothetical protein HHI36_014877 [Cryptolaemus montrouzieri]|uniref:Uncharacterized protein n=1 Tax=Cryptolaemus montrouzieri TaxID=559131 RepID=A0ABD2N407_9CUCU
MYAVCCHFRFQVCNLVIGTHNEGIHFWSPLHAFPRESGSRGRRHNGLCRRRNIKSRLGGVDVISHLVLCCSIPTRYHAASVANRGRM